MAGGGGRERGKRKVVDEDEEGDEVEGGVGNANGEGRREVKRSRQSSVS